MQDRFTITDILRENAAIGLYRGYRRRDHAPVIIKTVDTGISAGQEHECLRHEYEILQRLNSPYVLKPLKLDRQKTVSRLILEGFDGELLSCRTEAPMEISRFLPMALQLAAALADIHRQGIVHNGLNPESILVHPGTRAVRLTGFGSATCLARFAAAPAGFSGGSLAYMSPEQTGYLNRGVDLRSDLYTLGVIFYRLLTAKLPFQAEDPMELLHCHAAMLPQRLTGLPRSLENMILKLLEKEPRKRYQGAEGLQGDLEHCRDAWAKTGAISPFLLGSRDNPGRFFISGRVYGRKQEIEILTKTFGRAAAGQAWLMLVSGGPGTGKSVLVRELLRPVAEARGYFISGKFDQYQHDRPYTPLKQAFQNLIQQILAERDDRVRNWKAVLEIALSANGRVIADLIPGIETIIGPQAAVPMLPPAEARNRFHGVFHRFIGVFAGKEHPLVLFLDDLQWIDPASLDLMAFLMTRTDPLALMIIGAFRDNEVGPAHRLVSVLDEFRQNRVPLQQLTLGPLDLEDLTQLTADTLCLTRADVRPLARLIAAKTAGNPFFVIQFLTLLFQENLLVYDKGTARWQWNLPDIQRQNFTDNVVELMLNKIGRFSARTRNSLTLAACIGHEAGSDTLATISGRTKEALYADLEDVIDEGLLWQVANGYRFLHDRVQEAAYNLLPAGERPGLHLKIGRLLLLHTPEDRLNEKIFEIAGHLNQGGKQIRDPRERRHLAELNLAAGRRAKLSTAYTSAVHYFSAGRAILDSGILEASGDLIFSLYLEQAECEYLSGNFSSSAGLLDQAMDQARSLLDQARVFRLRQQLCQLSGQFFKAMAVSLEALRLFGISMPEDDRDIREAFEAEIRRVEANLYGRNITDLAGIPLTGDMEVRALIGLLTEASPLIYTARPMLWPLVTAKGVNLSLEHGHADESPFIYSCYAMVLTGVCRDIPGALRFSDMALRLCENLPGAAVWRGKIMFHEAAVIGIWGRHFMDNLPLLAQAFRVCVDSGDLVHAGYLTYNDIWLHIENGDPLDRVTERAQHHIEFCRQNHNDIVCQVNRMEEQFIRCLQGKTRSLTDFGEDSFDEAACATAIETSGFHLGTAYHYIMKLMAACLAGRYEDALEWAGRTAPMILQVSSMANEATFYFYHALTLTALYQQAPVLEQPKFKDTLNDILAKLEYWADHCPANFADRHTLVQAEVARIEKRGQDAMKLYEKAIALERENGFIQNEAVACEAAAMFYQQQGFEKFARLYWSEAAAAYARWGAFGKVRQLESRHPWLAHQRRPRISVLTEHLDAMAVVRAQQAISGEIRPGFLGRTLLKLIMENAGAQTGYLSVEGATQIRAEVKSDCNGTPGIVFDPVPAPSDIPMAIVNYVRNSRKTLILPDAGRSSEEFTSDSSLMRIQPKSVLCMPIQRGENLLALLYLENRLISGIFSPERCLVLETLAAQAAISLETAAVYSALKESEERLRLTLEAAHIGIFDWDLEQDTWTASPEYYTMLGYAPQQGPADREEWLERLHPDDRASVEAEIRNVLERKSVPDLVPEYGYEARLRHADGAYRWVKIRGFCIRQDPEGRVTRILGVRTDITEQKSDRDALCRLNTELDQRVRDRTLLLEAANKELESFAYSVSHDLRAPLRHITGFLALLQKKSGPQMDDQSRHYIDNISGSAQKMDRLIEDLLSFSRMGRLDLSFRQVDLKALADSIIREYKPDTAGRDVEWRINGLPNVYGDISLLRVVLTNLISNALKFTRPREQALIEIGSMAGQSFETVIFVRDNGVGFDMAYADKLFGVFQRLHHRDEFDGTGIGLATVHRIITRHGGQIWAEAQVGQGATFFFSLPHKPLGEYHAA